MQNIEQLPAMNSISATLISNFRIPKLDESTAIGQHSVQTVQRFGASNYLIQQAHLPQRSLPGGLKHQSSPDRSNLERPFYNRNLMSAPCKQGRSRASCNAETNNAYAVFCGHEAPKRFEGTDFRIRY
jgi:hypothetical protein